MPWIKIFKNGLMVFNLSGVIFMAIIISGKHFLDIQFFIITKTLIDL